MKKSILFLFLLFAIGLNLSAGSRFEKKPTAIAQDSVGIKVPADSVRKAVVYTASTLVDAVGNVVDTTRIKLPNTYAWQIDTRYGDRVLAPMDTTRENFHRSTLVENKGIAVSHLGNIGGPVQNKEFFARGDESQFPFMDPFEVWRRSPDKHLFLNTKIPYSNIQYQAGGGKEVAENHFKAEMSSNFGKRLNVGFNFDYIYARGYYKSNFNKQTSYDFNASYIGDKYKMHLFAGNNNLQTSMNGGIMDDRYITNPDGEGLAQLKGTSLDIPVVFEKGIRSKYRGRHLYLTNSYDIGRDKELVQVNDSTKSWHKKENYVAPASVIYTVHYQDQRRRLFTPEDVQNSNDIDQLRFDSVYTTGAITEDQPGASNSFYPLNDYMSHYTLKNTVALRLNEGFKSWTKFGLTAFVEHEMRGFLQPAEAEKYATTKHIEHLLFVGGRLSKRQGKHLRFNVDVIKAINTNDLEIEGKVATTFNFLDREYGLAANAYFKNQTSNYFQESFYTRNMVMNSTLSDVKRVFVGGEIALPELSFLQTTISGGYENITDYNFLQEALLENPKIGKNPYAIERIQTSKNVNVFALKLDQKLKTGILHIDLQALLQKSTEEDVIPLPLWTVYANIYLKTKVSKVLTVQFGVDAYMHAKYNAPGYDLVLAQFYNQDRVKLGGFPHANVYINLHLKYTRFFIMVYNVADSFGNKQYFTTPHYPNDPLMVRWGLSWKFNN